MVLLTRIHFQIEAYSNVESYGYFYESTKKIVLKFLDSFTKFIIVIIII